MVRFVLALATFAFGLVLGGSPAEAQKKVALVIGIDAYDKVPKLQRAVADARAVAAALQTLGFRVRSLENAGRDAISAGFAAFEEEIDRGDTAFVFFAGHGVEIRGQNLLLPADAPDPNAASEGVLRDKGFLTPTLIDRITDRGARAAFVVIDACRNNPYAQPGARRSIGSTRGLAKVDAPEGVFVLMSAGQNQEALDSLNTRQNPSRDSDRNSVFTRVFLDELARPGQSHLDLAKNVQERVRNLTREIGHAQVPAFTDQIIGRVVFREGEARAVAVAPAPIPVDPLASVRADYERAERLNTESAWAAFLATSPPEPYASFAREARRKLAAVLPAPTPAPVPSAAPAVTPLHECDRLAGDPADPDLPGKVGKSTHYLIDALLAVPACRVAVEAQPAVARFAFAYGRALLADGKYEEARRWLDRAAIGGSSQAMLLLADVLARGAGRIAADPGESERWRQRAQDRLEQIRRNASLVSSAPSDTPINRPRENERTGGLVSAALPDLPAGPVVNPKRSIAPLPPAEERALKSKDVFRECADCPEMVVVPAGTYLRGSPPHEIGRRTNEDPQRQVTIGRAFAVGKFEVSFTEWDECVRDGGCGGYRPDDRGWGRGWQPVINVSWQDAQAYADWLSRKTGKTYRLLTEAEWEYAARAGTTSPYSFGPALVPDEANFHDAQGVVRNRAVRVGSFPPNNFGLFDMHGNVLEWVADCYRESYASAPADGSAFTAPDCVDRVLRGGAWNYDQARLRSASRSGIDPVVRYYNIGFRLARTLEQ